jgi:hypothetical protein
MRPWKFAMMSAALTGLAACSTDSGTSNATSTPAPPAGASDAAPGSASGGSGSSSDANGGTSGTTGGTTGSTGGATGGSHLPTLVSVNLQNVLNNLSVSLQVNRNSIPVTAQVPIDVAAAVCGVSVDALAASVASGHGTCTATTTTPQLNQVVQQQISTGGNVQGGDQTLNTSGGGAPR